MTPTTSSTNASQKAERQLREATERFVAYYSQKGRVNRLGNGQARDFYVEAKSLLEAIR